MLSTELAKCDVFVSVHFSFVFDPLNPTCQTDNRTKLAIKLLPLSCPGDAYKVDLPEIKGNHRKFRNLVTSYIGNSTLSLSV